ncbi:MAG TPA: hypothetical protein VMB04_08995 [Mycobacterium sp.]|nr:hypothetical protein [Mycobacterium sp.]
MAANTRNTAATEPSLQLAGTKNARLSFAGPPKRLTGTIPLINETDTKLKLRSVALSSPTLKGAGSLPLGDTPFFARLYPGQQASVSATISLDPSTPPGDHQFELTVGKRTIAVDAHVEEVVDLRLAPSQITILADSETTHNRNLIVENAGNVDLPLGAESVVLVYDSVDLQCLLVPAINESDRSTVEAMLKSIMHRTGDLQAGTLIMRRDSTVLHPGQQLSVDVSFNLPEKLKPQHHYYAHIPLYNATLLVDIYTTANDSRNSTKQRQAKETAT